MTDGFNKPYHWGRAVLNKALADLESSKAKNLQASTAQQALPAPTAPEPNCPTTKTLYDKWEQQYRAAFADRHGVFGAGISVGGLASILQVYTAAENARTEAEVLKVRARDQKARVAIFKRGFASRAQVEDQVISMEELDPLGWEYDLAFDEWRVPFRATVGGIQVNSTCSGVKDPVKPPETLLEMRERIGAKVMNDVFGRYNEAMKAKAQHTLTTNLFNPSIGFGEPDAPAPAVQAAPQPTAKPLPSTALHTQDDRRKTGWGQ